MPSLNEAVINIKSVSGALLFPALITSSEFNDKTNALTTAAALRAADDKRCSADGKVRPQWPFIIFRGRLKTIIGEKNKQATTTRPFLSVVSLRVQRHYS